MKGLLNPWSILLTPQGGELDNRLHKAGSEGCQKDRCIKSKDTDTTPAGDPRHQSIPESSAFRKTRWRPFWRNITKNQYSAPARLSGLFRREDDQSYSYVDSLRIKKLPIYPACDHPWRTSRCSERSVCGTWAAEQPWVPHSERR